MNKKMKIALFLLITGGVLFVLLAVTWMKNRSAYASTDAVFVKSDYISNLSFKRISGKIVKMNFKEGDSIKKGDILAEIDDTDYQAELKQNLFAVKSLESEINAVKSQINKLSSDMKVEKGIKLKKSASIGDEIGSLESNIAEIDVQIRQANTDYLRYKELFDKNAVPKKSYEDSLNNLEQLKKRKEAVWKKIDSLKKQIDISKNEISLVENKKEEIGAFNNNILVLDNNIKKLMEKNKDIENSIADCKLISPSDGIIGLKYVDTGTVVKPGSYVYSIIDNSKLFIYTLMEETKLRGVEVNDTAEIKIDAFSKESYKGVVEKIYPSSAATYAIVPRDISAGEFTKVAQRVPIRIKITEGNTSILRVGMGGEVRIKR